MDNNTSKKEQTGLTRRDLIKNGLLLAGAAVLPLGCISAAVTPPPKPKVASRRKLGSLEVSAMGMGVQNMHRKYTTEVPYRPEMINIIRAAYDRGITFFDTAEAYGPFENERILGDAIQPFRNNVVITSKFGFAIDPVTGQRQPGGLNSNPEHIKLAVEGSLKRLKTDRIDLLYQHRVDPKVPIEDVAGAIKELMQQGICIGDFPNRASRPSVVLMPHCR